jgi:hypothetical protein
MLKSSSTSPYAKHSYFAFLQMKRAFAAIASFARAYSNVSQKHVINKVPEELWVKYSNHEVIEVPTRKCIDFDHLITNALEGLKLDQYSVASFDIHTGPPTLENKLEHYDTLEEHCQGDAFAGKFGDNPLYLRFIEDIHTGTTPICHLIQR